MRLVPRSRYRDGYPQAIYLQVIGLWFESVTVGTVDSILAFWPLTWIRYDSMNETSELRSLADKCRRLANAISDGPARENLQSLAAEYEQRAGSGVEQVASNDETPLMAWQDQG